LPTNGTLTVEYPNDDSDIQFVWTIAQVTPQGSTIRLNKSLSRASAATFQTAGRSAALGAYALTPGLYAVTVQAVNSANQRSAEAQGTVTLVAADFANVRVYPNPWRADRHAGRNVTIDNLTVDTTVKIFTIAGHHVKTLPRGSGSVTWDLTNDSGDRVASGHYIYLLTSESGQKKTGQIAVLK
jgi:hypothetical protein